MIRIALVAVLLAATPVVAAPVLPSLYDVTDVDAGDVLNVRAGPSTADPVIGSLPPDATGIEVVSIDATGAWGEVNVGEVSGWAALRFLDEQADVWTPGKLPAGLSCFGTEPFWNLRPEDAALVLESPEMRRDPVPLVALDTGIVGDVRRALLAADDRTRITATITPDSCGDGMSDRAFGLGAMVVLEEEKAEPMLLSGCCSIAPARK